MPRLISGTEDKENWPEVMEELRKGFQVGRASFYPVHNERVESGWTATSQDWVCAVRPFVALDPLAALRKIVIMGQPAAIGAPNDERLAEWPNREGINALFAVPVFSSRGSVAGVLEFVNRIPDRDHPFDHLDDYERIAAVEVAGSVGTVLDRRKAILDLQRWLDIANKIGATSVSAAISMHRLMSHLARLLGNVEWLEIHPQFVQQEFLGKLSQMKTDCMHAITMIQLAMNTSPAGRRLEDIRNIVNQAVRVVRSDLAPSNMIVISALDEERLLVNVEVFSVVHTFVNLLTNAVQALTGGGRVEIAVLDHPTARWR